MAYYLSTAVNTYISIPAVTIGGNVGDYFEFTGFGSAGNHQNNFLIAGQGWTHFFKVISTGVSGRVNGTNYNINATNIGYVKPADDETFTHRIEKTSATEWTMSVNSSFVGIVTNSSNITIDQLANTSNTSNQGLVGALYKVEFSTNGGASVTHNYDASASNGTGSTLPNTLDGTGATDGTLVNFTLPDAWVWYSQFSIDPTQWARRVEITDANVSPSLTGFTALITQANLPAEVFSRAGVVDGGGDLRVCLNSDGTGQLPLEVVDFNTRTSTAVLWTRFASFASGTSLWLFYDKAGETQPPVTDAFGRNAVWADYAFSSHDGGFTDSSGNRTSISNGGVIGGGAVSNTGLATDFDGTDDYFDYDVAKIIDTQSTDFYVSTWFNQDALASSSQTLMSGSGSGDIRYFRLRDNGAIQYTNFDGDTDNYITSASNSFSAGAWNNTVVYREFGVKNELILNNVSVGTSQGVNANTSSQSDAVGAFINTVNGVPELYFNGKIGEIRQRQSIPATPVDFAATEYNNQSAPSTFWSTGTPENTTGGVSGVTGNAVFDITKPTFSIAGSATVPSPTGDAAFDITKPSFSASGAATLPQAIGNISYSIDSPTFSSSGSATLPQPIGDIAYTINAPTFSVSGSATLPNPTGNAVFDISKPLFSGEGSATTPNPVGNIDLTITKPSFSGQGQATLPQPTGNIDFAINAPVFSGQGAAIGFEPIGNIAFDISSPTFSASGSATLPQPVGNASFTIDKPIFDILGSQSGVVISYSPDAIITVNSGQNIIIVTND